SNRRTLKFISSEPFLPSDNSPSRDSQPYVASAQNQVFTSSVLRPYLCCYSPRLAIRLAPFLRRERGERIAAAIALPSRALGPPPSRSTRAGETPELREERKLGRRCRCRWCCTAPTLQ